ncbi:LOW QUALITY PROTEIN: amyloid beta precursor like protein 1 [Lampris incognitus]|uniref:LOW QUALITY PROTEIN: amyloid beta precursor like protein 1 n=1 Tax=Lampris incognitus TaxID=2546036 RepID=UPI0024B54704|nr:LOW QUALITY PROTEIN: amyloid beta precursor like protein 1 [Lampris incognitus]
MGRTAIPILMAVLSHCMWRNIEALAMTEVNGPGPLAAEPQIAMFCGLQLLHMNLETGQWEPDPQGHQGCFTEPSQILSYCQEMYPTRQISHVEESSSPVTIPAWCKKGWGHCQTRPYIVLPYRCLEGEYVSEALLVPDRCRFLHQEQMDACESYVYWHNIAKEACTADGLELHSYGMLLPCEDRFRGVEYVCCPGRGGSSGKGRQMEERLSATGPQTLTSQANGKLNSGLKVTVPTPSPSPDTDVDEADMEEEDEEVVEEEEEEEEDEVEDEVEEEEDDDDEEQEEETPAVKEPDEYEYPIDSGPYQASDYQYSLYYEKSQGRKPTTSVPLTRGDSLPTPRPTDGVDVYFEMPGDDSEHANFLRAKMDLEERRMKRINEIMKEWAEADNQSKNLPKSERQALNEHFQSVLQTLEEQVAGERQRLVETHLARVVATLNNNRRLALESYLTAVQTVPPQPERVLQALKRYMAAEQKDRRHTLRHYQHIEAVDPQKAEQMKFQVYTHLHVIEERMNQSLALLNKVPALAEELHDDIKELVKAERGDISELMTTSFSETRTTEELLPAESEEEKDDEEEEERAFQNRPYPPRIEPQPNKKVSAMDEYDYTTSERGPTYEYEEKINTSVELKQVVYKSADIQRDELQPDALETFNRGAMVGLLVVAVAIAMVMVISLLLVRRKPYGTISHGIVEQVDPMLTPEERQLNKMQNHGYENPTYKFFEQMN